jgi:hypothetical protein
MQTTSQHRYHFARVSVISSQEGHYSLTGTVSHLRRTRSDLSLSIEAAAFNDIQVRREALIQLPLPCLRSSGLGLVSRLELSMPEVRAVGRQARDTLPMRAMRQLGWETRLQLPVRAVRTVGLDMVLSR